MIRWACNAWLALTIAATLAHLFLPDSFGMFVSLFHAASGWIHALTGLGILLSWRMKGAWWLGIPSVAMLLWVVSPGWRPDTSSDWVVVSQNINAWAAEPERQAERWLEEEIDVLLIQELSVGFARRMEEEDAHARFPHRFAIPSTGPRGLGIYSRYPLTDVRVDPSNRWMRAEIEGRVVYTVHTTAPFSTPNSRMRNDQMTVLAMEIQAETQPVLVVGDFNISPTSPEMRAFRRSTGLDDSIWRCGPWWSATWSNQGLPPVIRIDHVLTSESLGCSGVEILPRRTSDHSPVRAMIGREGK